MDDYRFLANHLGLEMSCSREPEAWTVIESLLCTRIRQVFHFLDVLSKSLEFVLGPFESKHVLDAF